MTRVTVDDELKRKLHNLSTELELCDDQGNVLARVKPVFNQADFDMQLPSKEELDRRSKSSEKRYTTQEMLDYLEKL
jgi:hypothetical protein